MGKFIALFVLLMVGCADTSHTINVAPSAKNQLPAIREAVRRLNDVAGEDLWVIYQVFAERRINGEIIVREVNIANDDVLAETKRNVGGVIINIRPGTSPRNFAHELVHAAGLEGHTEIPGNLMQSRAPDTDWDLTFEQIEDMR